MSRNNKENNILYVIAQNPDYNRSDKRPLLKGLLNRSDLSPFVDCQFLENYLSTQKQPDPDQLVFNWYPRNAPGRFIADQVSTPGLVDEELITKERMVKLLSENNYSHVYLASYLNGYTDFKEVAAVVKEINPEIKLIAGANLALLPETRKYVDKCLTGDSVLEMRKILNEPTDQPRKPIIVASDTNTEFHGIFKKSRYGLLITGFGCRYGCDFCPSTAQWGNKENYPLSAETIANAIYQTPDMTNNHTGVITLSLADPQGLGNLNWKEVFRLCRNLPFECKLVTTTSSKVIQQYDIDTLVGGKLHLSTVNIGVETLIGESYKKNYRVDLKAIVDRLQKNGIDVVLTYIVGFKNQNKNNILEEVKQIKQLGASNHIVANLELQPKTPLYNQYKEFGLILPVPPELLATPGYQPYKHPVFRPGLNDMLPLLDKVNGLFGQTSIVLGKNIDEQDKIFREQYTQIDLFHPYILTTN